ncbi:hypothetical protein [Kitasatospora cheerisanensis]|uniref:Uncharacterized protein n=1 Tax=Kitasatospora cheerisanensis KCTC 2395 TaxID=1348663 RepID=A0A066Z8T1_9ACTN|nr:hypothetical protein [Kitasatospora cheerisanensis]KDN86706.1 hypothetical protein KCH_15370 [Kitasatospora cheerisanensis KCTC 2395]
MSTKTVRPDDQPFDFNLDAVQAEVNLTPFVVHWAGRRWSFAHLQGLDIWEGLKVTGGPGIEAIMGTLRIALGSDDNWAEFQKTPLPGFKVKALFDAYQKHCGMTVGESPASADS